MNAHHVWQAVLAELQKSMTAATFETWVKHTTAVGHDDGVFTIAAPNTFAREWLDTRFRAQIEKTLVRILGRPTQLAVVVEPPLRVAVPADGRAKRRADVNPLQTPLLDPLIDGGHADTSEQPRPKARSSIGRRSRRVGDPPPPDERDQANAADGPVYPGRTSSPAGREQSGRYPNAAAWRPDERWSFETFVVGPSNRFAFAAAQAVADAPARAYNPLFIHGGVGLGKTHLLQAIAQAGRARGLDVLYVTCEQFTNDLIDAIQRRLTDEFRAAYRSNDVLLVDDVQFLAGKEATQEEFFHTFNDVHSNRRQIVLSSDRPPRAIATLEQRLTSRFEWGLTVDVQPPDVETRTAILRNRAAAMRPPVPDDVVDLLAQRVQRNVRELEGALTTVAAYARLSGAPLTVETATKALAEVGGSGRGRPAQPAAVLAAVARHYQLDAKLLRGKQRDREIVVPRQIAMYLMREETGASLLEIGRELGGRDHSTVLHGWEKIKTEVEVDDKLRRDVLAIRERIFADAF